MRKRTLHFGIKALLAIMIALPGGMLFGQDCPDNMIAYWKLSETSGPTYKDSYGIGLHEALAQIASPEMVAGASGKGQSFSPSTETYLFVEDHSSFDWSSTSSFTIEFWAKFAGTTGEVQVFISRDDRPFTPMTWWIGADESGHITWFMQGSNDNDASFTTTGTYNDNQWHHIVAVRNGTAARNYLYIDGILTNPGGTSLSAFGSLATTKPLTIGCYYYQNNNLFHLNGSLDEMAIYSRALTATEIVGHYNNIFQYQIGYCSGDEPMFLSDPVTRATVDQPYIYDVDASGNSKPTYELITSPSGMEIDRNTGVIQWIPSSQSANGRVVVRAENNKDFVDQEFNIFIADDPICRPGMIAYWDFNQAGAAGLADNIVGYQFTGEGPTATSGIAGNALEFDGINDSLNLKDIYEPSNTIFFDWDDIPSFSWEVWIKSDASPSQTMVIIGRDQKTNSSHYWLGVNPDGSVRFFLRDWPPTTPAEASIEGGSVLDGNWHHIVATYNATSNDMRLYVDKVMVDDTNKNFRNFGGDVPLNIGCLNTSLDKYWFEGAIDELGFYSIALSSGQITENYNNTFAGKGACTFNYAPVILSTPDSTVMQDALFTYEIVATDVNSDDILNISFVSGPAWMNTFSYTPGDSTATLSGTPTLNDIGLNSGVVRVSDGIVSVDQQFQVKVLNVNDAPEFVSVPVTSVDQNAEYSYTAEASDIDGDELSYSATVLPDWMSFDPETRILSGVAADKDVGLNDVTLRASDGSLYDEQSFQVEVINVNDAPVFTSTPVSPTDQGAEYIYNVTAEDPDGDDVIYSSVQLPTWLSFDTETHVLSGTPGSAEIGFHDVTLRVSDGLLENDQSFQIEVLDVNDAPAFQSDPVTSVNQDQFYSYSVLAIDDDGDAVSYSAPVLPTWLTFSSVTRILSGTPGNNEVGTHDVILRASDGTLDNDQVFQIVVNNINDKPEFTTTAPSIARAGQSFLYQANANDPDGDDLAFAASNLPSWLSLTSASTTAILSGTPPTSDIGASFAIILTVTDGSLEEIQAFSLKVVDPTGIGDQNSFVNKVYPNPVTSKVYFEFELAGSGLIKIVDTKGSVVKEVLVRDQAELSVDISDLPADVYFYIVTLDDESSYGKLIRK